MLETAAAHRFTFDTVQMPLNVMDAHYDSFERRVLPVAEKGGVAVLAMKPLGSGMFLRSAPLAKRRSRRRTACATRWVRRRPS